MCDVVSFCNDLRLALESIQSLLVKIMEISLSAFPRSTVIAFWISSLFLSLSLAVSLEESANCFAVGLAKHFCFVYPSMNQSHISIHLNVSLLIRINILNPQRQGKLALAVSLEESANFLMFSAIIANPRPDSPALAQHGRFFVLLRSDCRNIPARDNWDNARSWHMGFSCLTGSVLSIIHDAAYPACLSNPKKSCWSYLPMPQSLP